MVEIENFFSELSISTVYYYCTGCNGKHKPTLSQPVAAPLKSKRKPQAYKFIPSQIVIVILILTLRGISFSLCQGESRYLTFLSYSLFSVFNYYFHDFNFL